MTSLNQLHADIDARVTAIRADNPDWLCRMGCDGCCRRLAEIPSLTAAEWLLLQDGLATLSPEQLQKIDQDLVALSTQVSRPIVCPLLDQSTGACRVYAYRPVACRTYGFYVERDKGLYCKDIESQVAQGEWVAMVWGNQNAIDQGLRGLGDKRNLTDWFAGWKESGAIPQFDGIL